MKLSEAIILGDSLRERRWSSFLFRRPDGTFCGCAIGGAALACGQTEMYGYRKLFPWLLEKSGRGGMKWADAIGTGDGGDHPDFSLVVEGRYSIEQLADYVRSIEPDCGECNQFECSCPKAVPETLKETVCA